MDVTLETQLLKAPHLTCVVLFTAQLTISDHNHLIHLHYKTYRFQVCTGVHCNIYPDVFALLL